MPKRHYVQKKPHLEPNLKGLEQTSPLILTKLREQP